jgi:integrase
MASIYRELGKKIYMMQYYVNGRRFRESTRTDDERKAQKIANAKETDRDRGLPVAPGIGKIRWEEAVELIRADYANNDQTSWVNQERRIRLHLAPVFDGLRLADIPPEAFALYATARREAGASAASVNRELAIVRRMFVLAIQARKLLYAPHIPKLRERNARAGFFERATFESVYAHLPAALQPVVLFAYVTGWRIDSEVLTREWRHVDFDANEIRLDPGETKNGEARVFELTADLRALLLERKAARDAAAAAGYVCPRVFFRLVAKGRGGKKYPKPIVRFNKAWAAACTAAGCPGRIPHDFRRTAIRNMVRRGVPERVAMQMSGHLTRSVFERYNIVSPGDLHEATAKLEGQAPTGVITLTATPTATSVDKPLTVSTKNTQNVSKFGGAARI